VILAARVRTVGCRVPGRLRVRRRHEHVWRRPVERRPQCRRLPGNGRLARLPARRSVSVEAGAPAGLSIDLRQLGHLWRIVRRSDALGALVGLIETISAPPA
jgi:hypothetical protein